MAWRDGPSSIVTAPCDLFKAKKDEDEEEEVEEDGGGGDDAGEEEEEEKKTDSKPLKIFNICWKSKDTKYNRLPFKDSFADTLYFIKHVSLNCYCCMKSPHPLITPLLHSLIATSNFVRSMFDWRDSAVEDERK